MGLNKQKRKEILSLRDTLTVAELAAQYKVTKKEIEEIIRTDLPV